MIAFFSFLRYVALKILTLEKILSKGAGRERHGGELYLRGMDGCLSTCWRVKKLALVELVLSTPLFLSFLLAVTFIPVYDYLIH